MKRNYKVAIVEDEENCLLKLKDGLRMYENDRGDVRFDIRAFQTADRFLQEQNCEFEIVFMDIDLPGMSGMECARILRETDTVVTLIFVTNLAQYAVQGYEVSALDYIVKPVTYKNFAAKMDRALKHIDYKKDRCVTVQGGVNFIG